MTPHYKLLLSCRGSWGARCPPSSRLAARFGWLSRRQEGRRKVLRAVPVEPGELFGSAALEALERAAQAKQTRQQLSGLHRSVSAPRLTVSPSHLVRVWGSRPFWTPLICLTVKLYHATR